MMEQTKLPIMVNTKRGPGRLNIDIGLNEGFKYYNKFIRENKFDKKYRLSRKNYGKIIKLVNSEIRRIILYESATVKLPAGLPALSIIKFKRKIQFNEDGTLDSSKMPVNYPATLKLWRENKEAAEKRKLIFFINDHTDGYSCKVNMSRYRSKIKNIALYNFKTCRKLSRELAKILLDPYNKIDYYS